eukprot:2186758-Alexandrium_andersonii.AAC.1
MTTAAHTLLRTASACPMLLASPAPLAPIAPPCAGKTGKESSNSLEITTLATSSVQKSEPSASQA